jgi:hypothetical protein
MHNNRKSYLTRPFLWCSFLILFYLTGFSAYGQQVAGDTIKSKGNTEFHSPRKATIYSAVLPGLGQIYNKKYWKLPFVYGGFVAFGYFINLNNNNYLIYSQAYSDITDNNPLTNSFLDLNLNPGLLSPDKLDQLTENLQSGKDYWRRNRDYVIIFTALFYAANIIDASVDAHFFNFDISDDLTMNWVPGPVLSMDNKGIGIHCRINF